MARSCFLFLGLLLGLGACSLPLPPYRFCKTDLDCQGAACLANVCVGPSKFSDASPPDGSSTDALLDVLGSEPLPPERRPEPQPPERRPELARPDMTAEPLPEPASCSSSACPPGYTCNPHGPGCVCSNPCKSGESQCNSADRTYQTCIQGQGGCWFWSNPRDCSWRDNGETRCSQTACCRACNPPPSGGECSQTLCGDNCDPTPLCTTSCNLHYCRRRLTVEWLEVPVCTFCNNFRGDRFYLRYVRPKDVYGGREEDLSNPCGSKRMFENDSYLFDIPVSDIVEVQIRRHDGTNWLVCAKFTINLRQRTGSTEIQDDGGKGAKLRYSVSY